MTLVGVNQMRDMAVICLSVIILLLVGNSLSSYNPSICSILEESYGLIPPPLPKNFEMKAEHVDHMQRTTSYEEIYFDFSNSRAKYKYLLNTVEYNYLFDYNTQQVVEWLKVHPGESIKRDPLSYNCEAVNMESSKYSYIFGYQDWITDHPKIFNAYQVLRYGGQYLYAANGTMNLDDRGLKVNKFLGCLYDDTLNATMFNDYYFADTSLVQPSGGTPSTIVTGADDKPLSVPVKLHITGGQSVYSKVIPFNRTISISWFKGNPVFQPDTFQIPPWIHCKNYRGRKEAPKLPTAFSTRLTMTRFQMDMFGELAAEISGESYEEIYYDQDKKLARRDFIPQYLDRDIYRKFGNSNPVSTIYDFNEGVRFTTNKHSGRCYIAAIMENEYFDTERDLVWREMATPEEIFMMQMDDMEYKGKAFARDIECDVFNGRHYHQNYNATLVKETYFSTDGWYENVDGINERHIPVKHVIIEKELDGELVDGFQIYNFLRFNQLPPKMVSFDIENCVELIDHKRLAIDLLVSDEVLGQIFKYKFLFLEAAQLYIAKETEIKTPLRVQRLHLRDQSPKSGSRVFLVFSLLDKAKISLVVPQRGKDLQEAIVLLQKLVDAGNFTVEFNDPSVTKPKVKVISVQGRKGGLYTLTGGGKIKPVSLMQVTGPDSVDEAILSEDETMLSEEDDTIVEEKKGMTGGNLTLLAFAMLFIGVGIGIAVMYLYIRMYNDRYVENKIQLSLVESNSS